MIDELRRQTGGFGDLQRFDLDFDLPDDFLPEFDAERRGEALFKGKAQCASCHPAPSYLDNQLHDLRLERFFTPRLINCREATAEGPIKAFTLRGIKDSPPYMHDGRLLTLDDTVEFFNLVLQTHLTAAEKSALLAFLYTL